MAKKARSASSKANPSAPSRQSARLERWETEADIPDGDEDVFERARDKVLLEPDRSERETRQERDAADEWRQGREVLRVTDAEEQAELDAETDSEGGGEGEGGDDDDEGDLDDSLEIGRRQAAKLRRAEGQQSKAKIASRPRSHVAAVGSDEDDGEEGEEEEDENGDEAATGRAHVDRVTGWGANKRAYYDTNRIEEMSSDEEIDEEEARKLELEEVRRLQTNERQGMRDADFGLEDARLLRSLEGDGMPLNEAEARARRRAEFDGAPVDVGTSQSRELAPPAAQVAGPEALAEDDDTRARLLAQVQQATPETLALAGDFADLVEEYDAEHKALQIIMTQQPSHPALGLLHVHHHALLAYLCTAAFYFHMRASHGADRQGAAAKALQRHAVMQRLATLKRGVAALEELGFSALQTLAGDDGDEEEEEDDDGEEAMLERRRLGLMGLGQGDEASDASSDLGSLEEDELAALMEEEKENQTVSPRAKDTAKAKAKKGTKAGGPVTPASKKKAASAATRQARANKTASEPKPLASLAELAESDESGDSDDANDASERRRKRARVSPGGRAGRSTAVDDAEALGDDDDDGAATASGLGEPTTLSAADSEDKAARRHTLRFHASQLASREARRAASSQRQLGGDADVPYRDRERSRLAVAQAQANKAARQRQLEAGERLFGSSAGGGGGGGTALDGADFGDEDARDWRDVMGISPGEALGEEHDGGDGGDDGDGDGADAEAYYSLVASGRRRARDAQKRSYDAELLAQRVPRDDDDAAELGLEPGEHRAIGRQIEKNRGLSQRRPKENRNPRVKKRLRYERAQKRLSSTRAVFKTGEAARQRGSYQGEASGISTNVVKSRKFGRS